MKSKLTKLLGALFITFFPLSTCFGLTVEWCQVNQKAMAIGSPAEIAAFSVKYADISRPGWRDKPEFIEFRKKIEAIEAAPPSCIPIFARGPEEISILQDVLKYFKAEKVSEKKIPQDPIIIETFKMDIEVPEVEINE